MITKTKQDWGIGKVVKVGFLSLRIIGMKENIYILESLDSIKKYEFVPYLGLVRTN